jgi:hypothetical protein
VIIRVLKRFHLLAQLKLPRSFIKEQHKNSKEHCIRRRKKSFDGIARCKSRYDSTECCRKHEWLRRSALYGGKCNGGVGNIDHIIEKIVDEARKSFPEKIWVL